MEYKSKSQIARIKTEEWALKSLFCPICGKTFTESSNNTKFYDFSCVECEQFFQLKAHAKKIGKKLIGSEYYSFIKSLEESIIPNFLLMHYELEEGEIIVQRVIFIPKTFITPEVVEKRKPLSSTAKRAGWTGYNLLLDKIPTYGITEMLTSCKIKDKTEILKETKRISDLYKLDKSKTQWKIELLRILDKLPNEFTLSDVYKFSHSLINIFPGNNHIEDKIRQQLQMLRDSEIIEFIERGKYRKRNPTPSSGG